MMKHVFSLVCTVAVLTTSLPLPGQLSWHFEFEQGHPVKLIWETEPGRRYLLRETPDLRSWTPAPGFPQTATGTFIEYPFIAGPAGFFDISIVATGGGWQLPSLPALPPGESFHLTAISALNSNQLWISGSVKPGDDACVLRSDDGGLTWALVYRASGIGFFGDLHMTSPLAGFMAGSGVRRTSDGGATWQFDQGNLPDPPGTWHTVGPDGYVYGMAVVGPEHVWTAGYDGAVAGVIYHRIPERPQPDPANPNPNTPWWLEWGANNRAMYGLSAVNTTTAWAVGSSGFIWKTTDGQHWSAQSSGVGTALQDVKAVDAQTAWAVGDAGTILKTADGGQSWTPQTSGTTETLWRIAAVDTATAWAVGGGGTILHTVDGGAIWTRQPSGTSATLRAVAAVNPSQVWVAGDANTLLLSTDGGTGRWAPPVIASVTPNLVGAYSEPAMTVTILGSGFRGGQTRVTFGDTEAEPVAWIDEFTLQVMAPIGIIGTTDVKVTNEDGQQGSLPRAVTFLSPPIITEFSPLHGPASGGYTIGVNGFNLQSVTRAEFYHDDGSIESLPVTVTDSTRVAVTVPTSVTRAIGPSQVILRTAENQVISAAEFRLDPATGPTFAVTDISPRSGGVLASVTVTGVGFSPDATLEMCGRSIAITSRSATHLTGLVFGSAGLCQLMVRNSESEQIMVDPGFLLTSDPAPTLGGVSPNHGPKSGGTPVTLTGTGFMEGDAVTFDGYPADIVSRQPNSLVVITPPHAPGTVSIIITSPDLERGSDTLPQGFVYE
jgi:photosystem II stability/assembly factor-like uncharacterized protein